MQRSPRSGLPVRSFLLRGDEGLAGRLALSWSICGGLSMVAVLVLAAYLSGAPDAGSIPFSVTLFFLVGAGGGFLHGSMVGVAGRAEEVSLAQAIRAVEIAALWALPGLAAAWVCGLWIAMTSVAVSNRSTVLLAVAAGGWAVFIGVSSWAVVEARTGLRHAIRRWPERRPGVVMVVLTFVILLAAFVWQRPEIWFTDLRVSALGAIFLALGATVWIALPVIVFVLHFLHQWRANSPIWEGANHLHGEDSP